VESKGPTAGMHFTYTLHHKNEQYLCCLENVPKSLQFPALGCKLEEKASRSFDRDIRSTAKS